MAGQVFRSCPFCGHGWQADASAALACPKCGRENTAADEETPAPGSVPAVTAPAAPSAPKPPPRKAVSQRPIATPKKSHGFRNTVAIVLGGAGALAALHFAGVRLIPDWKWEPAEEKSKKAEAPVEKPNVEAPKEVAKPKVETPKDPDPEPVAPKPKVAPREPAPDFSKETAYTVAKVVTGDLIVVKGGPKDIEVHLIGVKAAKPGDPEIRGMVDGKVSQAALAAMLPKGKKVFLYYGQIDSATSRALRDSYGTDRAWVFLDDGTFVNLEMIREGKARVDTDLAKEFLDLLLYWEEKAQGR